MASPSSEKILKQIQNGTLKVSYKKFGKLKSFMNSKKINEKRYFGLNTSNIGDPNKNTIEFRMANGSLDPEVIKQTVFLYGSLINTAIQITEHPELYVDRLKEFFKTDISEEQKAHSFLNLIMEHPEDRQIFIERWESVRNAPIYDRAHKKGFASKRFQKEDFEELYESISPNLISQAYSHIKSIKQDSRER